MDGFARHFDLPKDSPEYIALAESAWMGGPLVGVRFYLGYFIGKNLFRETDEVVEDQLVSYMTRVTSAEGAAALRGLYGWGVAMELLQFDFEQQVPRVTQVGPTRLKREIQAVKCFLANPSIGMDQLARDVGTTEKQLSRNSLLTYAKDLIRRRALES